jgi:hypothetical protein
MNRARVWLAGLGLLSLGLLFAFAGSGNGGDDDKVKIEKARKSVLKIAAALEKKDNTAAAAEAKALAKSLKDFDEIENVMAVFKLREKNGLGVGSKRDGIVPDGIELKLLGIARDAPGQNAANKEAEALEKMAYVIAAVAEVALAKPPDRDEGKKKKKDFIRWAKDMRDAAPGLAVAAKSKSPAEIQKAAAKINSACTNCHSVFK